MKKRYIIIISIIAALIAADLVSKIFLYGQNYSFLSGFISIIGVQGINEGAAFGIFKGYGWLFILLASIFIIAAFIFDFKFKNKSVIYTLGLSFVLGGTIGNLIDRIFLGGVRDFFHFDFFDFPIFNLADCFLTIGCVLLIIFVLFIYRPDKEKNNGKKS